MAGRDIDRFYAVSRAIDKADLFAAEHQRSAEAFSQNQAFMFPAKSAFGASDSRYSEV